MEHKAGDRECQEINLERQAGVLATEKYIGQA